MTTAVADRDLFQGVSDLLLRYATGIDQKDWMLFRTCFVKDCHADYGDIGIWKGVDAITEYMTRTHPENVRSLHRITNVAITPRGDGVESRSYVDLIYVFAETASGINAVGHYDDDLVRTPNGWRIAHRRYTMVHMSPLGRRTK